ncbi:hypothetical protein PV327_008993 [Microctonus hyperodae]|uniref:Menorin-like domain-containing protein n=1 Tax=Microctonus hyperodae TaxID=165561 RepID=A0AA39KVI5_MICHY|nr:hypothetical protein PV327_008993 [Microctonus hyperodae]
MMIEADVGMGTLINGTNDKLIPIMTHPPHNSSDLSLEIFLKEVFKNSKRGIKLDFKTIEAFKASLPILKQHHDDMIFPVWLNADIINGPTKLSSPVDANEFLSGAAENFPECTLSVGWTTSSHPILGNNSLADNYSQQQIQEMIDTLSKNNITQRVTYPVRAAIAANSFSLWSELLKNTTKNHPTLTIWSSELDYVDAGKLSKLIRDIGVDKVYVDVPDKLWEKLNISAAADNLPGIFMVIAIITANFILNFF